jgi:hypothetical protein
MKSQRRGHPSFFKQVILIATPLVILSAISLYSIRQDKSSIERDARDRARILAPELARQWSKSVSNHLAQFLAAQSQFTDTQMPPSGGWLQPQCQLLDGKIRVPVDYPHQPVPPDWPNELNPAQLRLWRAAEEALFLQRDPKAARAAITAMKRAQVPEAVYANDEFNLLLLESRQGTSRNLAQRLTDLAHRYSDVRTETGTSLADLALIHAFRNSAAGQMPTGLLEWIGEISCRMFSAFSGRAPLRANPSVSDKKQYVNLGACAPPSQDSTSKLGPWIRLFDAPTPNGRTLRGFGVWADRHRAASRPAGHGRRGSHRRGEP